METTYTQPQLAIQGIIRTKYKQQTRSMVKDRFKTMPRIKLRLRDFLTATDLKQNLHPHLITSMNLKTKVLVRISQVVVITGISLNHCVNFVNYAKKLLINFKENL